MEIIKSWWNSFKIIFSPYDTQNATALGQLGDWFGGIFGTLITFASLLALLATFWLSRAAMNRQGIYAIFSAMSKTHDDLVASFQLSSAQGADVFRLLLSDYAEYLDKSIEHCPDLDSKQIIDLSYTLFFYGSTITGRETAEMRYDPIKVKAILDAVSAIRNTHASSNPGVPAHRLSGNQARLSNYYRNLYGIYSFIDESSLSKKEKKSILKTIRTKMSNHEQALLSLNICSHLGTKWKKDGLLKRYEPIKNIPRSFMLLPGNTKIEQLFPEVRFEFEDHL